MTPEMIDRATANAAKTGLANVDFRLGEIEHLPVEDTSVDVIMSNCVINLAPDKPTVLGEAFRVHPMRCIPREVITNGGTS